MRQSSTGTPGFVFGVVDAPPETAPDLAAKLRDLTVSWSRYSYRGPIVGGATVDAVLQEALVRGYGHCFVQFAGNVIREHWAHDMTAADLPTVLAELATREEYLVAGCPAGDAADRIAARCLLVDLRRYHALGSPVFGDLAATSRRAGLRVLDLQPLLGTRILDLRAAHPARAEPFARYLGAGIGLLDSEQNGLDRDGRLSEDQRQFLGVIKRQVANARRGVFLWNIEPYDDVTSDASFRTPVATLYTVAAGFKPNAILHAHGFDAGTRVAFFDYSPQALAVRRRMVEEWDGSDFPRFVRYLFQVCPSPATFYHLWGDLHPEDLDWRHVEERWERELAWWGGAAAFREHWAAYRALPHLFIQCDLLDDPSPVLNEAAQLPRSGDVVWWSNAFFTMYGNWFHSQRARQEMYECWMSRLADANPEALLYGSDNANANVNGIRARDYWLRYRQLAPDYLEPAALHVTEIRM